MGRKGALMPFMEKEKLRIQDLGSLNYVILPINLEIKPCAHFWLKWYVRGFFCIFTFSVYPSTVQVLTNNLFSSPLDLQSIIVLYESINILVSGSLLVIDIPFHLDIPKQTCICFLSFYLSFQLHKRTFPSPVLSFVPFAEDFSSPDPSLFIL